MALGIASKPAERKPARADGGGATARNAGNRHRSQTRPDSKPPPKGPRNGAGKSARAAAPRPAPGEAAGGELSLEQAYRLRQQQEKEQAEQARRRQQEEMRKRQQLNREIKAIVEPNRLNHPEAEIPRYFIYKGRIRKVNVTDEQRVQLNGGDLGLVYLSGAYHLLPAGLVEQVKALSAEHVPDLSPGDEGPPEDDVPDDLVW